MTKKILGVLITLALLAGFVAIPFIQASQAELVIVGGAGEIGDEVEVSVSISNNPGIAGMVINLDFDSTYLKPVAGSVTAGAVLSAGEVVGNINEPGADMDDFDFILAVLYNADDATDDGVLFTVKFEILAAAEDDDADLSITFGDVEIINEDLEAVTLDTVNGEITLLEPEETPTPIPTETPTESPKAAYFGDLNEDGFVDMDDLIFILDTTNFVSDFDIDDVLALLDSEIFNQLPIITD